MEYERITIKICLNTSMTDGRVCLPCTLKRSRRKEGKCYNSTSVISRIYSQMILFYMHCCIPGRSSNCLVISRSILICCHLQQRRCISIHFGAKKKNCTSANIDIEESYYGKCPPPSPSRAKGGAHL